MIKPMWRKARVLAPLLAPHHHLFDSRLGVEPVMGWTPQSPQGVVLYCSCGSWRVFYR